MKKILQWAIGLFLLLGSAIELTSDNAIGGLLIFMSAALLLPPIYEFIEKKYPVKTGIRAIAIIFLFFVGVLLSPDLESLETESVNTSEQTQSEVTVNQVDSIQQTETGTVTAITDGDTLTATVNGTELKIRLIGINTPELSHPTEPVQCYANEARAALESLVLNKEVTLEKDISDTDRFDRYLRYLWIGETLVNEYMVQNGYAQASAYPPDVKYQERFTSAEQSARNSLAGFWAKETCDGNVYTGTYKDPNKNVGATPSPVPEQLPIPPPQNNVVPAPAPNPVTPPVNTSPFTCNCSKTCGQMVSCEEAYFQLNNCGCSARDGNNDGVPCESICRL